MITLHCSDTPDGKGVLTVAGDLTVEHAGELKALLLKSAEGKDSLSLDLTGIASIDVAGLQLLCAAHKAWRQAHKEVVMERGTVVREGAYDAGFTRMEGCGADCIWRKE